MTVSIYLDKSSALNLPKHLAAELESRGLIEGEGTKRVSFCGIIMLEECVYVFMPRSSDYKNLLIPRQIELAAAMVRAVEKYGREKNTRVNFKDEDDGEQGLSKLSLIRNIFDDFMKNGIYTRRKIIRSINNAKPDWNRTISRSTVSMDKDGKPVYLDIHCTQRKFFSDSEVSAIHAGIIRALDRKFSWILTGKSGLIAPELNDHPLPVNSVTYQIYLLQKELHQAYAERDVRLLKFLINYLKCEAGINDSNFIAGIRSFHFAWEHMLRHVLSDVIEVNHLLPAPCYVDASGTVLTANDKSMRTDIVLEDYKNELLSVIDAKYYAANIPENAPGWNDLVKQFFYAKALKLVRPKSTIRNIFVFPGNGGNLSFAKVRDRRAIPDHFYDDEFSPIECMYVCPLDVIDSYAANKKIKGLSAKFLADLHIN